MFIVFVEGNTRNRQYVEALSFSVTDESDSDDDSDVTDGDDVSKPCPSPAPTARTAANLACTIAAGKSEAKEETVKLVRHQGR